MNILSFWLETLESLLPRLQQVVCVKLYVKRNGDQWPGVQHDGDHLKPQRWQSLVCCESHLHPAEVQLQFIFNPDTKMLAGRKKNPQYRADVQLASGSGDESTTRHLLSAFQSSDNHQKH